MTKEQSLNKNTWTESLTRNDLIMLNRRSVIYISHKAHHTGSIHYTVIDGKHVILASDALNCIEPVKEEAAAKQTAFCRGH